MLYWLMGIKVVASGIFLSNLLTSVFSVLNFVFFATSFFTTTFNFFKSIGTASYSSTSKSSTFVSKLFKIVWTLTNLLTSSLSTSVFKAIKFF